MNWALLLLGAICLLPLAGFLYQLLGTSRDARRFPPPGRLVDVGGRRIHVHLSGEGHSIVVFEAGIAACSVSWAGVRTEVEKFARVCVYDRAGLGWSEAAPIPRTLANIIADLEAMLSSLGEQAPLVLVGHSFGGLVALEFACRHPAELGGLVLVDALPASEWRTVPPEEAARLRNGIRMARRAALLARFGVVRFSLDLLRAGSRRIPKVAARISSIQGGSKVTERIVTEVRKLPPSLWPIVQAHWCQPKSYRSMASHLECLPASAAACSERIDLGDLRVVVLSAADSTPARSAEHARMARQSSRGEMIVAENSGHWIQLDQPELVVAAIRKIVSQPC